VKLLFLSACGKTKEAEDNGYINLYLASLKQYIVPHFDVKVILFNNALNQNSSESQTFQRVKEFGLEHIVEVKNMYEMGLPQESVNFLDNLHWFGKIGINMNMLFDYAKMNNFFDADWVFHFDTDLEFLPNFKDVLMSIDEVRKVNNEVMITAGGDTYPYNIRYKDTEFIFWIGCHYSSNFEALGHLKDDEEAKYLQQLWEEKGSPNLQLTISHDKGSLPQFFLQGSSHNVIKIQVRGYSDMAKHFSSGYYEETPYRKYSEQRLKEHYTDTQHIWEKDYLTKEEIESRIFNLQNEIQRLQQMLN